MKLINFTWISDWIRFSFYKWKCNPRSKWKWFLLPEQGV